MGPPVIFLLEKEILYEVEVSANTDPYAYARGLLAS